MYESYDGTLQHQEQYKGYTPTEFTADRLNTFMRATKEGIAQQTPKQLRKAALRIQDVHDFFKANPDRWIQGTEEVVIQNALRVCFVGALWNAKKVGLKWTPESKGAAIKRLDWDSFIDANDSAYSLSQFLKFLRSMVNVFNNVADAMDRNKRATDSDKFDMVDDALANEEARITKRARQVKGYQQRNKMATGDYKYTTKGKLINTKKLAKV